MNGIRDMSHPVIPGPIYLCRKHRVCSVWRNLRNVVKYLILKASCKTVADNIPFFFKFSQENKA